MADLTPAQYAQLRDSVCAAVTAHITDLFHDARAAQEEMIRTEIAKHFAGFADLVGALQLKQDDLAGRFSKLESADRYAITRRALVDLLEKTDAR